jgi:hypothetical protein
MPLYWLTIFIGAFLLFQIQPIIARMILPWFGGAAAVWSACLLFFQVVLLLGYVYAHLLVRRLRPKAQFLVHATALGISLLALNVLPNPSWKPSGGEDPVLRIVWLLTACVGLPYLLLSSTSPLMQAWYARAHRVESPYVLYAISNLGCLLALLSYPVLVEPLVAASNQARIWSLSYGMFCLLSCAAAWRHRQAQDVPTSGDGNGLLEQRPSSSTQVLWLALAACSGTLLPAITNYLSQNVASVPFLWIMPLSLYLLSFVLTFKRTSWYKPRAYFGLLALSLSGMCYGLAKFDGSTDLRYVMPLFGAGFFICCMFCHGELARLKPHARDLTGYYLIISLGGASGGLFVGAIAPRVFRGYFELPVAVFGCAVLGVIVFGTLPRLVRISWVVLTAVLGLSLWTAEHNLVKDAILMRRNFYGSIRVVQDGGSSDELATRTLVNGTITHGLQYLSAERRHYATTYYGPRSGVGLAIEGTRHAAQRVGVIGLGAGTLAAYGKEGDYYRFYEINPTVIEVARREFTYLADCRAKVDVVLGDARLSMEREDPQKFDVLVIDAFSSDSIPVHLLTREAFDLFFRHLCPGGILAVHVSNTHLELAPVVERLATALDKRNILVENEEDEDLVYGASWVLVADQATFEHNRELISSGHPVESNSRLRLWTDDYSNLIQILK